MTTLNREAVAYASDHDTAEWYLEHAEVIRRYIIAWTRDPVLADDVTSQTFLRAIARRDSFRCRGDGVRPWLVTIARNIVRDQRKSGWHRHETVTRTVSDRLDNNPTPERILIRVEERSILERCLQQLSPDQERCVRLRFLEDLSVSETAQAMDRDPAAVRSLQLRALRALRGMVVRS